MTLLPFLISGFRPGNGKTKLLVPFWLVGHLFCFPFPMFQVDCQIPGWLGDSTPGKPRKVVPASFLLSHFTFILGVCFSYSFLVPQQKKKQGHCLLIPSLLSRRAERANSVTLRFVSAKEIAILTSNLKTLETKESLSMVDF